MTPREAIEVLRRNIMCYENEEDCAGKNCLHCKNWITYDERYEISFTLVKALEKGEIIFNEEETVHMPTSV